MKFIDELIKTLKKEKSFLNDNNDLLKHKVIDSAIYKDHDLHSKLLHILLNNPKLKEEFFYEVNDITIFERENFCSYLKNNEFLDGSYTQFDQSIGFNIRKELNNNVVLDFPYKDCILEGGQTKEEQKKDEIFFNEILAKDEITQLLIPKVLTNAKKYDSDGEHKFTEFNRDKEINKKRDLPEDTITDNLLIKGNNLLVLKTLEEKFREKVKLIYIDPPYNTGGDTNIFTYNNSFNHSTWLTFMKNRLEIAKILLKSDGFIAIAIDHFELGYLIVLADEIFGRDNRLGIITVVHKPGGRNQEKFFSSSNEFMLVYSKERCNVQFNSIILSETKKEEFNCEDEKGKYKLLNLIRNHVDNLADKKPNNWYEIYISKDFKKISLEKKENFYCVLPVTNTQKKMTWQFVKETFIEKWNNNEIVIKKENNKIIIYRKYRPKEIIKTHWSDKRYNATHHGTKLLEKIIGRKSVSYPKSLYTVLDTLKITTDKEDIIMDFYAGSGTTGHAVLELNKEDGGNRQFILVEQLDEHIKVCKERIQQILRGYNLKEKEILPIEVSSATFIYFELKQYNEKFVEDIKHASSKEKLVQVFNDICEKGFSKYNIGMKALKEDFKKGDKSKFLSQSISEIQEKLYDILDKNMLYVPLELMNDERYKVSGEDKELTKSFYKKSNDKIF